MSVVLLAQEAPGGDRSSILRDISSTIPLQVLCRLIASAGAIYAMRCLQPAELGRAAAGANLDVVALTDHDTTGGWAEAIAALPAGLTFVSNAGFGTITTIMAGQLGLIRTLRGLTPAFGNFTDGRFDEARYEELLEEAENVLVRNGVVQKGDLIVITIGEPIGKAGGTNTMKIVRVGEHRRG